jgi:hypothetical protein
MPLGKASNHQTSDLLWGQMKLLYRVGSSLAHAVWPVQPGEL